MNQQKQHKHSQNNPCIEEYINLMSASATENEHEKKLQRSIIKVKKKPKVQKLTVQSSNMNMEELVDIIGKLVKVVERNNQLIMKNQTIMITRTKEYFDRLEEMERTINMKIEQRLGVEMGLIVDKIDKLSKLYDGIEEILMQNRKLYPNYVEKQFKKIDPLIENLVLKVLE